MYFVVNLVPAYYTSYDYYYYYEEPAAEDIIPLYREDSDEFDIIVQATGIGYVKPLQGERFLTVASVSMTDETRKIRKDVIAASGQNVYASLENLYVSQKSWREKETTVVRFALKDGKVFFDPRITHRKPCHEPGAGRGFASRPFRDRRHPESLYRS